jgi:3-oxoacyl-[acyl-carrier protein] reductase
MGSVMPSSLNQMSTKTVLVTGSSRGIGAEIARRLASESWNIILHYTQDQAAAQGVKSELGSACAGVIQADLRSPEQTERLWHDAKDLAPLDALVNNAGIYIPCPYDTPYEQWDSIRQETFRINFEAAAQLTQYAVTEFKKLGAGKVLNVGSRVGFRGEARAAMYAASKAALLNLTRSLAVEYARQNIQFFGIAPGWVETAMARDGMDNRLAEILEGIPSGRMAMPADCASAAAFLLKDESTYLTGEIIDINGASYFH